MLRLSNPTGEAADLIEELGINVFDAEGNMKSMPGVISELNDGLQGMESDARAAALATIFGSESTAGWSALLDRGADELNNYTGELNDAEGAASDMAETMEDNGKGSLREFRSALEEAGIVLSETLLPVFTDMIEGATDLAREFGELDESTQKNIVRMGGLAMAAGPVVNVMGNLTTATGGVVRAGGSLVGMLGKSGGTGLLGRLAGLGRGGVVGLAIGGVGALAYGIHKLTSNSEEAEDVNLDLAKSFSDQAAELDNSVDTFDELSDKAKISNSQLAEMHDLNQRISDSSNPGEIAELKDRYEELADSSGLSKDEIEKLFKANDNIIEQSPEVETAVSDQGNEFVESSEKVQEYIDKLREQSEIQVRAERQKLLEQEQEAIDTINQKKEEQEMIDERIKGVLDATNMTNAEITDRVEKINGKISEGNLMEQERNELETERHDLLDVRRGKTAELLEDLQQEYEEIQNSIASEEEKLEKLDAVNEQMANIYLQNVGINEQGEEGLEQLDKTIAKNQEEIDKLEEKRERNGELSEEEQTRLETLQDTVEEHENAKIKIFEETELYNDLNSLAQLKLDKLDEEGQKRIENLAKTRDIKVEEGNIVEQMRDKNSELLEERENLIKNLDKNGENSDEIREQISEIDTKIIKNDTVLQKILKELGIWEDVKDEINSGADGIDGQNSNLSESERKLLGLIGDAEDYTDELRKDVNKTVNANLNPSTASINSALGQTVYKQVRANVTGDVFARYGTSLPGYAAGTDYHPGGKAIAGELGQELARVGNRWSMLNYGVHDLPRGTQVFTHDESKRIINALNNMPGYASGVSPSGEADRIVSQLNNQQSMNDSNGQVVSLLRDIAKGIRDGKIIQVEGQTITQIVNENNAVADATNYF